MDPRDRVMGCLLGGAVGDALGAPVEFLTLADIRQRFGPEGISDYVEAYGRVGAITDDTQMTLFTAEGLVRAHVRAVTRGICHPPSVIHHAYLRWLVTQGVQPRAEIASSKDWPDGWLVEDRRLWERRAPGRTCLTALSSAVKLGEGAKNDSKGCGTVMRVAPIGIARGARVAGATNPAYECGEEVSHLTHGHPAGFVAGGAFAQLIALVMEGLDLDEAVREMEAIVRRVPGSEVVVRALDVMHQVRSEGGGVTPENVERLGGGWVAEEALAIAIYCALEAESFEHGVRSAVNHSGDSDSTGSMTGQLLGVARGWRGIIPERWLADLELRDVIEHIAEDLAAVRVGNFDAEHAWHRYPGW